MWFLWPCFSQTWPPVPPSWHAHSLWCPHQPPATLLPNRMNCYTLPLLSESILLIHYEVALFAQSAKRVFEYYTIFTLGIWSMLLNAHDLFFHLILLSITTSWCNAPVNPCTLTICLCSCNNTALHAAWMPMMTNAEFSVMCSTVPWFIRCKIVHIFTALHCLFASPVKF